jgi:alpha-glucosidase (family GH31 glycosyl hydrolase)
VANYSAANIPLDVQWSDIDYLQSYRDFTHDPVRYADLPDFINELHTKSMHYVPILDAGIAKRPTGEYP